MCAIHIKLVGIPVRPESGIRQEGEAVFEKIKKRNGRVVDFDSSKITAAIAQAGHVTGEFHEREAKKLTLRVLTLAHQLKPGPIPEVEEIQDIVERVLLDSPFYKTAKAYILYREQHAQIRQIAGLAQGSCRGYCGSGEGIGFSPRKRRCELCHGRRAGPSDGEALS